MKLLSSIFLFLLSPALFAFGIDTSFVGQTKFHSDLRLTYGFASQYIDLYTSSVNKIGDHVYYSPNVKTNLRISANLRFLTLSYGTQIANKLLSPETFGSTQYRDFNISTFRKFFGLEIYFRDYDGLYNPKIDYSSTIIRPDASISAAGMNFYIIGNGKKFSYRAASAQTMVQRKSAGTLIIKFSSSYRTFTGSYSLLPAMLDSEKFFGQYRGMKSIKYLITTLSPGYARNFSIKNGKWFICPILTSGLGLARYDYSSETAKNYLYGIHWNVHFRLFAGYNLNRFFYGIYFDSESNNNFLSEKIVLNNTSVSALATAGMRFWKKK